MYSRTTTNSARRIVLARNLRPRALVVLRASIGQTATERRHVTALRNYFAQTTAREGGEEPMADNGGAEGTGFAEPPTSSVPDTPESEPSGATTSEDTETDGAFTAEEPGDDVIAIEQDAARRGVGLDARALRERTPPSWSSADEADVSELPPASDLGSAN